MSRQKPQTLTPRRTESVTASDQRNQVANSVSNEQIAARAYEIFLARGGEDGHDIEDWYQAERELKLGRQ